MHSTYETLNVNLGDTKYEDELNKGDTKDGEALNK